MSEYRIKPKHYPQSEGLTMRALSWNVKGASADSLDVWDELTSLNPDVALLQEVAGVSDDLLSTHRFIGFHASTKKGGKQRFKTGVLVRGGVVTPVRLTSDDRHLQEALDAYSGNIVHIRWERQSGEVWHLLSCYSPAWPLFSFRTRIPRAMRAFRSKLSDDLWLTDLLHRYVREQLQMAEDGARWMVAGDFNSATTFSWERGQNQEFMDNMLEAGLEDAIFNMAEGAVPTFRHSRGSVKHQLDYFYLCAAAKERLISCKVLDDRGVFECSLSDHLPLLGVWSD